MAAPPSGVEASVREGEGRSLLFLINHVEAEQVVEVPAGKLELLTQATTAETLALGSHGVAVLQL